MTFICDAYTDRPRTRRAALEFEIARLKLPYWGNPGDVKLLEQIEALELELVALDGAAVNGGAS
jgi:hypothetical protein